MNDFLRPCNCVHPSEEDCEKCVEEAAPEKEPEACGCQGEKKAPHQAKKPEGVPSPKTGTNPACGCGC